jgi:hypothetical protein
MRSSRSDISDVLDILDIWISWIYGYYAMNPKKATHGPKSFSFLRTYQTLPEGLIDTTHDCAQSTLENRGQIKFSRKLRVKILFSEGPIFIATQYFLV